MTVNLRSSAESVVSSLSYPDKVRVDELIEPQISRILADQMEGRRDERPQKNAHNRMLLAAKD
jgi:SUMO ligase MMS21 Smc5/6 complex component